MNNPTKIGRAVMGVLQMMATSGAAAGVVELVVDRNTFDVVRYDLPASMVQATSDANVVVACGVSVRCAAAEPGGRRHAYPYEGLPA